MAADKKLDVTRLLPPSMRESMRVRRFPAVRILAWTAIVVGLIAYRSQAGFTSDGTADQTQREGELQRVTVSGGDSFALVSVSADQGVQQSLELGGTQYPIVETEQGVAVNDPAGGHWAATIGDDEIAITENEQPRFRMKQGDEGYSVRGIAGDVVYKVKQKEEKVNVYGADEQRLLHGKLKKGQVQYKDDHDVVALRVDGEELARTGVLALPIAPQARALGWALQGRTTLKP